MAQGTGVKIQVFPGQDGQHYVRIRSTHNGEKLLVSEGYSRKETANETAETLARELVGQVLIEHLEEDDEPND